MIGAGAGDRYALLISNSTSTKWLHQAVRVDAGLWYVVAGLLQPNPRVDQAWLRVAWYASEDGSGAQLGTDDSPAVAGSGGSGFVAVASEPLQAPGDARSARIRIMLRPLGGDAATLAIDDISFQLTEAPGPETSLPEDPDAEAAVSPPDAGGPETPTAGAPTDADTPAEAQRAGAVDSRPTGRTNNAAATDILLRITEVLPDPIEPGQDGAYEWAELTNVGTRPIQLAGLALADNWSSVPLPDILVEPGVSIVIAAVDADLPEIFIHRLAGRISNGLGNAGDRLALLAADGQLIDGVSWGSDATYSDPPLRAPGPGRSIQRVFADDGSLAFVTTSDSPSPGRVEAAREPAAPTAQPSSGADEVAASVPAGAPAEGEPPDPFDESGPNRTAWVVLAVIATGALVGAAAYRVWIVVSGRPFGTGSGGGGSGAGGRARS